MIRTFRLVPTIALAVALLGGAADAQTIKIGVNEPLTGAFAASGTYVVNGAKIAADEINAKGGILGKKLELVIEDNKSNPTEAAASAIAGTILNVRVMWFSNLTLLIHPQSKTRRSAPRGDVDPSRRSVLAGRETTKPTRNPRAQNT